MDAEEDHEQEESVEVMKIRRDLIDAHSQSLTALCFFMGFAAYGCSQGNNAFAFWVLAILIIGFGAYANRLCKKTEGLRRKIDDERRKQRITQDTLHVD